MPSLHIAWAVWCTLAVWRATRRWARALASVYPLATAFAVLATGNHFLLDMLAGLLAFAASVAIVELSEAALERRRGRTAGPRAAGEHVRAGGP